MRSRNATSELDAAKLKGLGLLPPRPQRRDERHPREWVTALTYDANKLTIGAGGSIHVAPHWRVDAVAALVMLGSTTVDPSEVVPRVNPVKGNPTQTEAINGGTYSAQALIRSVGAQYTF